MSSNGSKQMSRSQAASKIQKMFRARRSSLAARLKSLENKQKADDKNTEHKVQYYNVPALLNNIWASNGNFVLRLQQGVESEGTIGTPGLSRIGNTVNLRSVNIKFYAALPKTSDGVCILSNAGTQCRVIIADNLSDNTSLVASDILQTPSYGITSTYKNSVGLGKRYKVYFDKKFTLTTDKPDKEFSFNMKLPKSGRVVHFNKNVDTNPSDLNLSMIYLATDIGPTSPNQPVMKYFVKSRFTDA